MDLELAFFAERRGLRLQFARGARNDRRTARDFLREMISSGKSGFQKKVGDRHDPYGECLQPFRHLDGLLITWANRGSHSPDVTKSEASALIDACEDVIERLKCESCGKLVTYAETKAGASQCECGTLRWR